MKHSAILSTFTKLQFVIICLKTGFIVNKKHILVASTYMHVRICVHVGTSLALKQFH